MLPANAVHMLEFSHPGIAFAVRDPQFGLERGGSFFSGSVAQLDAAVLPGGDLTRFEFFDR